MAEGEHRTAERSLAYMKEKKTHIPHTQNHTHGTVQGALKSENDFDDLGFE
jgi:hypothetical protein